MPEHVLSVVLFHQGDFWVAQCLEYDLVAQAEDLSDLRYEFERVLIGHMVISRENDAEPFVSLPAAPVEYWTRFAQAARNRLSPERIPFRLPMHMPLPQTEMRIA